MKNFWKWILGIVIVLVVLFGLGIGSRLLMGNFLPARTVDFDTTTRLPMMGARGFQSFGGPMMHFGGGFMMLGWLVPLILVGLVVYGAFRFGKQKAAEKAALTPPAAQVEMHACPHCGASVQQGWKHCSNCGKKL